MNKTKIGVQVLAVIIVVSFSAFVGYGLGYVDGFEDGRVVGWNECVEIVNEVLPSFAYKNYMEGLWDGFFWGWVEAWRIWNNGESFIHPNNFDWIMP